MYDLENRHKAIFWHTLGHANGKISLGPVGGPHNALAWLDEWAGEVISASRPRINLKISTSNDFGIPYTILPGKYH